MGGIDCGWNDGTMEWWVGETVSEFGSRSAPLPRRVPLPGCASFLFTGNRWPVGVKMAIMAGGASNRQKKGSDDASCNTSLRRDDRSVRAGQ